MPNSRAHLVLLLFEWVTDRKQFRELVSNSNHL